MKLKMNKKDEVEEDKNVIQEELLSICLNPNVLTDFKLAGDPEVHFFWLFMISSFLFLYHFNMCPISTSKFLQVLL